MAKKIEKLAPGMSMPPIVRMFGQPLDNTSLFLTRSDMEQYAASSPLAYVGQILVCYNRDTSGNVEAYIIQDGGSLQPLGAGSGSGQSELHSQTLRLTGDKFNNGRYSIENPSGEGPFFLVCDVNGISGGVDYYTDESLMSSGMCQLVLDEEIASWITADDVVTVHVLWT